MKGPFVIAVTCVLSFLVATSAWASEKSKMDKALAQ